MEGLFFKEKKQDAFNYFNKEYNENNSDNFLQGKVTKINNINSITTIKVKKYELLIISKKFKKGDNVLIRIKSNDLVICKSLPKSISALNYFNLRLKDIKVGNASVTLYFQFNNILLKANITKVSLAKLNLNINSFYVVLIKALNINDVMTFSLI